MVPGLQRSSSVTSSRSSRSAVLSRAESIATAGGTTPDAADCNMGITVGESMGSFGSLAELRQQQIARDLAAKRQQLTKRGSVLSNYIGLPTPARR